jgi:hypothetical protein
MTEQEIRQIVREEVAAAFKELYNIADDFIVLKDRWGTCYGTRPKYDTKQCFAELARRLAIEVDSE